MHTLVILDANPVYDTPGELGLADAIGSVPFTAHLGLYDDETAARCTFRLPRTHELESWSDLRAFDGTASIVQPLIRPLYDTRTAHELLAMLGGLAPGSAHDLVRQTWQPQAGSGSSDDRWRQALHDGVIAGTQSVPVAAPPAKLPLVRPAGATAGGWSLVLKPNPSVWDGRFANNAWLQECSEPLTKQVWGNALHVSETDARELGLVDGDVARLTLGERVLEAPVLVRAGQADKVIEATLGHGRVRAGAIGTGVGFDIYRLRKSDAPWVREGAAFLSTGRAQKMLLTQHYFELEGEAKQLQPRVPLAALVSGNAGAPKKRSRIAHALPAPRL